MSKNQTIAAAVGATMIIAGAMPAYAMAVTAPGNGAKDGAVQAQSASEVQVVETLKQLDASLGIFAWDQSCITPNDYIKSVFAKATAALCGSHSQVYDTTPMAWTIQVGGDVANGYSATVEDLAKESSVSQTMTCTCGGNPADGRAIITANVKGLSVNYLVERASAKPGVNTVTFVSADGTQVAMPLAYVVGHHGVVSFEINDEDLSESVGGFNQLWLEGASANYFVRDIVSIEVTEEENVPPVPGEGREYPNSPNVGVLSASVA